MRSSHGAALARYAASAMILLALSACYEEEDTTIPSASQPEAPEAQSSWLAVDDSRPPASFLAAETGAPAASLSAELDRLSARYRESPRMIANRVLQLWREYPELPPDRLMADLVAAGDTPAHSLGPVIQQYRVLRAAGADHATALAGALPSGPADAAPRRPTLP